MFGLLNRGLPPTAPAQRGDGWEGQGHIGNERKARGEGEDETIQKKLGEPSQGGGEKKGQTKKTRHHRKSKTSHDRKQGKRGRGGERKKERKKERERERERQDMQDTTGSKGNWSKARHIKTRAQCKRGPE